MTAPEPPTPDAPDTGRVEASYRAWVTTLGQLSPRQSAEAEHLYALAAQLDLKGERPAAAMASLSRAVRKTADSLRDEKNAAGHVTPGGGAAAGPVDIVDEIGAKRAERRAGA